jgi:membrane-bound lytic murein transglycosylase F
LLAKEYPIQSKHWSKKYDRHFKKYSKRYFGPHFNWLWFKSQGIAESGLQNHSTSHRNAKGIMQILPSTFKEIKKNNPHFLDISSARWNIAAGIYYDKLLYRRLDKKWRPLSENDQLYFMFAGYNAGFARISRALGKVKGNKRKKSWKTVQYYLPNETQRYVKRIRQLVIK